MRYRMILKSPKKEEQEVPDSKEVYSNEETSHATNELEGFLGLEDEENLSNHNTYSQPSWDFMDWEEQLDGEDIEGEYKEIDFGNFFEEKSQCFNTSKVIKSETLGFWDVDEKKVSLMLNLNYQEVLDAWSDRGPLLADGCSLSLATNGFYMGEVPVIEEERTRREASVLRYKEKRRSRLFSKKIRYQVRKLNADKRPRLKGRFVKRTTRDNI